MPYIGQSPSKGDENNFKILDDISSYTLTFDGSDSSVVSAANDTITSLTHRFVQGQRVTYTDGSGSAIAGLTDATVYFIIKEDHNTIKLATSASNAANGVAVNITNVGSGSSHTLNVAFDGVNTKFKATHTNGQKAKITRSAQLVISMNGVIQQPHDTATPSTGFGFDLDGTIVFSQAPVSSDVFWAHVLTNNNVTFDISDNDVDNFTGNGSTVSFNLSKTPPDNRNVLVTVDGVVQYPNDPDGTVRAYTVVENVLTFTTAPASATEIQVRHIGFAGSSSASGGVTNFYGRTGSVVLKNTDNIVANNAEFAGNLTVQGTMTTLDTKVTEVDQLEVAANNTTVGVAITQSGTGDILNLYDGSTEVFSVADGGASKFSGNVTIDAGANTTLDVVADSDGVAMVRATGASNDQTTAAFELVQSTTSVQGGGISYNGDGSPSFVNGETADHTTFYRMMSGTRYEVFSYPYNSNTVTFNGDLYGQRFHGPVTGNLTGTVITAAQSNITSLGTLTGLSVSGATSPISFTHTGGNCVTFNRNGKQLAINANYAGNDAYANIIMTSGMDIRWTLGGADRINFKSAGHIEPHADSQINLGADAKRFANVYADNLYSNGTSILTGVGIGTDNPATQLEIHGNSGGTIRLAKGGANRTSVVAGDTLGKIEFRSYDSSLNHTSYNGTYVEIETVVTNDLGGNPSEEVRLDFKIADSDEPSSGKVITPVPALSILQGGKVGIGTDTPSSKFHIHHPSTSATQILECSSGSVELALKHTNGYGSVNTYYQGTATWRIGQTGQFNDFSVWQASGVGSGQDPYRLAIKNSGNVGVSTHTPREILHVNKNSGTACILVSSSTAPQIRFNPNATDGTDGDRSILGQATGNSQFVNSAVSGDTVLRGTSSGSIKFGIANDEKVRITSSGNLEIINNNDYLKIGAGGALSMVFTGGQSYITNSTGHLTGRSASYTWENLDGTAEYVRISSSGRVGINTTSDSMDGVTGNLNIANTNFNNHTVINLSRNTASDRAQIRFQNTNGNIGSIDTFGSDLIVSSGNDLKLRTNGNERVIIASDGEILIPAAGANRLSMRHTSGGKFVIKNPTAANLSFGTNNNDEELVLENGGNFGISETNPQAKLHVRDDYDTETIILKLRNYKSGVNTKPTLRFEAVTASGQGASSDIQGLAGTDAGGSNAANESGMKFIVRHGGSGTVREAYSIKKDGNIHFPNGQGIDFSATEGTSNTSSEDSLFHDYEKGLWTPTVTQGIDGTGTFSIVRGWYIKVGDLVQISFFVRFVNNATGSTGNGNQFKMGGLPYTAAALSPAYSTGGVVTYTNCYFNNSNTIVFSIYGNTTQMEFHSARSSAANLGGNANNNRDIYGVGTYRAA